MFFIRPIITGEANAERASTWRIHHHGHPPRQSQSNQVKPSQAKSSQSASHFPLLSPPPPPFQSPENWIQLPKKTTETRQVRKETIFWKRFRWSAAGSEDPLPPPPPPLLCRRIQTASSNINNFILKKKQKQNQLHYWSIISKSS